MKPPKDKSRNLPTVWVGECRCGAVVFEVSDGIRFDQQTMRRHTIMECEAVRRVRAKTDLANVPAGVQVGR